MVLSMTPPSLGKPTDKRTGRSTLAGSALSDPDDRAADKLLGKAIIDTGGER